VHEPAVPESDIKANIFHPPSATAKTDDKRRTPHQFLPFKLRGLAQFSARLMVGHFAVDAGLCAHKGDARQPQRWDRRYLPGRS
jgi:hypothetical protein